MNQYKLSPKAEQDLDEIWLYLSEQDEISADRQIAQILNKFPMLAQYPDMGRSRDEIQIGLRSFPCKPYVIFYTKTPNAIKIVRIMHQARSLDDLLDG
jgi:toxin ParE1/3/4